MVDICKRIRAIEGQYVVYRDSYRRARVIRIPPNHVWLQGDNPSDSTDSRKYGPVSTDLVISRIIKKLNDFESMPRTFEYLSLDIERDDLSYTLNEIDLPLQYRSAIDSLNRKDIEPTPAANSLLWDLLFADIVAAFKNDVDRRVLEEQAQEEEEVEEAAGMPLSPPAASHDTARL